MALAKLPPPPPDCEPGFYKWALQLYQRISGTLAADTVTTNANLTGPITSVGNATSVASQTGTGSKFVMDTGPTIATATLSNATLSSPTMTTPVLGVATGTSLTVTGKVTSSGAAGIGYATGAGSTVSQPNDKFNQVTINAICGAITTNSNTNMATGTSATFKVNNSTVASTDVPVVCMQTGGTADAYRAVVTAVGTSFFDITLTNISAGSLQESPIISFVVIKAVTS
jgi:hypothetical protein